MKQKFILLIVAIAVMSDVKAIVPPTMGWSSWNTFALNINEEVIKGQADAMVATGLDKVGYKYVNIDDGYWDGRDAQGHLRLNTEIFPNGMRVLTDYIHKKGLKAGIYSDAGDNTCGCMYGDPKLSSHGVGVGFYGHDQEDCNLYFNDWNFDFIKVDFCGGNHLKLSVQERYTAISNAIKQTKKPHAVLNICRWAYPGTWASDVALSWRTTGDIRSDWKSLKSIIKENRYLSAFTGGGHYNDMDMLEIGRTLTHDEEITHMVMWCELSSPLLIGCDLRKISDFSLLLLKNKELIAINQDKLGLSAPIVQREGDVYVYAKDIKALRGAQRAVAVCNLSDQPQTIQIPLQTIGYEGSVKVRDAVNHVDLAQVEETLHVDIPAHGSRMLVLKGSKRTEPVKYEAEAAWMKEYNEIGKPSPTFCDDVKASTGCTVGFLGNRPDNYLEWRNVFSQKGGKYRLMFRYASGEDRTMKLTVNGEDVKEFTQLNSGGWGTYTTCSAEVTLKKGFNTVRLSNPNAWMPDMDCMEVSKY